MTVVKSQVGQILAKLRSRVQTVLVAYERGFVVAGQLPNGIPR